MASPIQPKILITPVTARRRPTVAGVTISLLVIIIFCRWVFYSKIRYAVQYGVPISHVTLDSEPHDCDWLMPPIGNKGCYYELQKRSVITSVNASGKTIVSYDEGKTWQLNSVSAPAQTEIFLSWQKFVGDEE